jgi:hypothetical protein
VKERGNDEPRRKAVEKCFTSTDGQGWTLVQHDFWVAPFWFDLNTYKYGIHSRNRIFPLGALIGEQAQDNSWSDEYLYTPLYGSYVYDSKKYVESFRWVPILPLAGVYREGTPADPDGKNVIHYMFPFFMRQVKNRNMHRYGVLGPLFWHRTKGREGGNSVSDYDLMWPLINFGSRTKTDNNERVDYWRLFPVVWRSIHETDSARNSKMVMPLLLTITGTHTTSLMIQKIQNSIHYSGFIPAERMAGREP